MSIRTIYLVTVLMTFIISCGPEEEDSGLPCEEGFTADEISDNYQIVEDYDQSIHELIVCGNITIKLTSAVQEFIFEWLIGSASETIPEGMQYESDGSYVLSSSTGDVSMSVIFINGVESSLGSAGSRIVPNLFEEDNCLVGADIDASLESIEISFDESGPLVELLGFGPNPESPIVIPVTLGSLLDQEIGIDNIQVASDILVSDEETNSLVTYSVDMAEGTTLDQVLLGTFEYEVNDAEVERSDLSQNITTTLWDLNFSNASTNSRSLTGSIAFTVSGGHFPYIGTMTWTDSSFGEEQLSCIQ